MDDKRVCIWREILSGADESWVLFENGTCVILTNPSHDLRSQAIEIMKEWGPAQAGTDTGDFSIATLDNDMGWLVTCSREDIMTFVGVDDVEDRDMKDFLAGLHGRSMRNKDSQDLVTIHVEDKRLSAVDFGHFSVAFVDGNIVDHKADGLISTGNVFLNMSGGVNGELLSRGGTNMQKELHSWLADQPKKYVKPGFAMAIGPEPFSFKCVVYTVAVDAFYASSIDVVCLCLEKSFAILAEHGCKSVAVPAMATGYGRLSKHDFGVALRKFLDAGGNRNFERIDVVCERDIEKVKAGFG